MAIFFDKKMRHMINRIYNNSQKGIEIRIIVNEKTKNTNNLALLYRLMHEDYIKVIDAQYQRIDTTLGGLKGNFDYFIVCTPKGREYVENKRKEFIQWLFPLLASFFALLISIITLFIKSGTPNVIALFITTR